ncbi:MAG: hypothetical protein ACKPKO_09985, partial [Candidatus Fonsibacter sp.]
MKNQDEYNMYVSMLDEEELECLKYAQRLRKYTHRHLLAPATDTDGSKPEDKKRGRTNKVGGRRCNYVRSGHPRRVYPPSLPRFICTIFSYDKVPYDIMLVSFELLAQHIVSVVVL